jgi:predicted SnoaL-like aldol condensation-catalyzing enzyme
MKTANEAANEALLLKVVTELFNDHGASALDRYFSGNLIQHNPQLPDGTDALRAVVTRARSCMPTSAWSPPTGTS